MKLFTRNDLERCARLATVHMVHTPDPETAIAQAVGEVAADGPAYFDEGTVRKMLEYAASSSYDDALFEEALDYAQR